MKKCLLAFVVLFATFATFAQNYQYINSNTSFNSGTYYISGWGNVTLTVPAGQDVTFIFSGPAYGGGNLTVDGKLTTSNGLQTGGPVTVGANATVSINGTFTPGTGTNLAAGSATSAKGLSLNNSMTVAGNLAIDGDATLNNGGLTISSSGNMTTRNITFNGTNTIGGSLTATNNVIINGGTNTMTCPGNISTSNLTNKNANTITGSGYIAVTGTFSSDWNPLTNSETITLNSADVGNGDDIKKNPGKAKLSNTNPCVPPTDPNTLPVVWGAISARISNQTLAITWFTLSENNNRQFQIEVSADGKAFHKIGDPISSKAENGNSDSEIGYSFGQNISNSAFAATAFALLLLIPGFSKRKKWSRWIAGAAVVLFASTLYSCSRQDAVNLPEHPNVFVRITQVDKDGTIKYSPVVKAVQ